MEEAQGTVRHRHTTAGDEADSKLARLGIKSDLNRNAFSGLSMLGMAFSILNSWCAIGSTVNASLPSGGPSAATWGMAVAGIMNMACGVSLAEFMSAYPTAGGQYHWVAAVSWKSTKRGASYITGWINLCTWVCITGSVLLLISEFVTSYISLLNPAYNPKPWHQFLLYICAGVVSFTFNLFANRFLPYMNKYNIFFTLTGFIITTVTILACASPDFQSGTFVFRGFTNESGWPDGWAWQLGLLQGLVPTPRMLF